VVQVEQRCPSAPECTGCTAAGHDLNAAPLLDALAAGAQADNHMNI
jgi:hypothetical protein